MNSIWTGSKMTTLRQLSGFGGAITRFPEAPQLGVVSEELQPGANRRSGSAAERRVAPVPSLPRVEDRKSVV